MQTHFAKERFGSTKVLTALLLAAHEASGFSMRDVSRVTGIHPSHISLILSGKRRASRDALILLCTYGWMLDIERIDEVLELAGYKSLMTGSGARNKSGSLENSSRLPL
jgi:transcriptional regulator with XRE-family HTH domain